MVQDLLITWSTDSLVSRGSLESRSCLAKYPGERHGTQVISSRGRLRARLRFPVFILIARLLQSLLAKARC